MGRSEGARYGLMIMYKLWLVDGSGGRKLHKVQEGTLKCSQGFDNESQ